MRAARLPRRACLLAAALLLAALLPGCSRQQRYQATWFDVFDSVIRVTAYCDSDEEWQQQSEALHADLLRYHQLFDIYSHYDGVTNLADVNDAAGGAPVAVDDALLDLLALGKTMYAETGGRCNIAAGAVLSLWHGARETETLPGDAALQAAAGHCGIDGLVLDEAAGTVQLTDPELRMDAGSIAKGWAIEAAARAAEARGLDSALIDAGSNIRAIGAHADGKPLGGGRHRPLGRGRQHADRGGAGRRPVAGDQRRHPAVF